MFLKHVLKPTTIPDPYRPQRDDSVIGLPAGLALLLLVALIPVLSYLWHQNPGLSEENGAIEWLQVVILIGAVEAHGLHAWRLPRSRLPFVLSASLATLAFAFSLREIDVLEFGESGIFLWIESALQVLKIAVGAALLVFLASRMRLIMASWPTLLRQPVLRISLAGGVLLLAGIPFDDNALQLDAGLSRLIEELLELACYALLFIAAMTYRQH